MHSFLRAAMTSCHKEGALNRNVFFHTSGDQSLKSIAGSFSQDLRKKLLQGSLLALDGCWQSLAFLSFWMHHIFLCFFLLIGGQLLYNIGVVFAIH